MKMNAHSRTLVAVLALIGLAVAFWALLLSPKREEVNALSAEAAQLRASVAESQRQVGEAEAAKREFPGDYQRLVVLGQAVPSNEETSSLLVELSGIARQANVRFAGIQLDSGEGGGAVPTETTPTTPTTSSSTAVPAATVPPTEAAAALLPLGAAIGPAGLGVMPYKLSFSGSFFQIADFIAGIDSLVSGSGEDVDVEGRLVTLNGFSLKEDQSQGFPHLEAGFSITTYLTPPSAAAAGTVPTEAVSSPTEPAATETAEPSELASETTTAPEAR